MGKAFWVAMGLAMGLSACGGTPKLAARRDDGCGKPPAVESHALHVYLSLRRETQRLPLCNGQDLTDDDTLWVTVELDTASFVRMVFVTPEGEAGEVIRQDAATLTREAMFRAPRGLMSHGSGEAQLVVVASRDTLSEIDPMLGTMLDVIRDTGIVVDRDGSLQRPESGAMRAEEPLFAVDTTDLLSADFNPQGVAVLPISLQSVH